MFRKSLFHVIALVGVVGWITPATADTTMTLSLTSATVDEPLALTLEELDALPQASFTTSTIWTDGEVAFSGVPLKVLLEDLTKDGSAVEMVALNDYKVTMPLSQLEDNAPMVATRMNGKVMSVRDKGPYWVVFPYDTDAKYQSETIYSYSIWQLVRLKVVD